MKRHYILPILFILCICMAVSCQKTEPPVSPRFQLPTISSDVVYPVEDRGADAAFGGKCFYYLSASSSEVRALDLSTGEDWVLTDALTSPALLAADGDEVCVYDESDSLIHRFSHEGSEIGVYIPPEPPEHGWKYKRMAVFHGTVAISSDLHLWIIDGGTGKTTEADLSDCEFREIVHPFVADCDTIYFVGSMGNASYNNTLYKCTGEGIVNEKWTEAVFQAFCMMGDEVVFEDSVQLFGLEHGKYPVLATIDPHNSLRNGVALRMAFSENSLAVEWLGAPHQVVVYPITVSEEGAIENEN